jgi:hypothetical protein
MLKNAVFAPIPNINANTTDTVYVGVRARLRRAERKSIRNPVMSAYEDFLN